MIKAAQHPLGTRHWPQIVSRRQHQHGQQPDNVNRDNSHFKRRGIDRGEHDQHGGRDQSTEHANPMHDAVRDQFGPIIIPANGARRRMDGRRGELLQSEDSHGESASSSVKTYPRGGQRTLKSLASNRVVSMKLDFRPLIATFRIVLPPIALIKSSFFPPAWPSVFPILWRKRACRRGPCWILAITFSIRRFGSALPAVNAPARPSF